MNKDETNVYAWNVYLANYWRISYAAIGHPFGPTFLGTKQKSAIERAARLCPDDPVIRLWLECTRGREFSEVKEAMNEAIKQQGILDLEYPVVELDYY